MLFCGIHVVTQNVPALLCNIAEHERAYLGSQGLIQDRNAERLRQSAGVAYKVDIKFLEYRFASQNMI